jgi:hypothetical protein
MQIQMAGLKVNCVYVYLYQQGPHVAWGGRKTAPSPQKTALVSALLIFHCHAESHKACLQNACNDTRIIQL